MTNLRLVAAVVVLALALVVLAGMQLHGVSQLADAHSKRLHNHVVHAAGRVAVGLDQHMTQLFSALLGHEPSEAYDALCGWLAASEEPNLVSEMYLVDVDSGWTRVDLETGTLSESQPPSDLHEMVPSWGGNRRRHAVRFIACDIPAMLIPLGKPSAPATDNPPVGPLRGWCVLRLNQTTMINLVDKLARQALDPDSTREFVWHLQTDLDSQPTIRADHRVEILPCWGTRGILNALRPAGRSAMPPMRMAPEMVDGNQGGGWTLFVRHHEGSLERHVAAWHRHYLLLVASVFAVLLAGMAVALVSVWRERRLARQQLAFTAGISHELMTPLAAIKSAAQNLNDGLVGDVDRVREYGRLILGEQIRLHELVDEVLALARFEGGTTLANMEQFNLDDYLQSLLVEWRTRAAQSDNEVRVTGGPGGSINSDPTLLRTALGNIVQNAFKYASGQPVEIHVERLERKITIEVCDRGPGFDLAEVGHLFEPFRRGDRARRDQIKGSGLGLHLARRSVQQLGGTITVGNVAGGGARVIVQLPILPESRSDG